MIKKSPQRCGLFYSNPALSRRYAPDRKGRCGVRRRARMKIATFNINNVNKHLPNLLQWLKQSKPDIVCLQELKCEARDFPEAALLKVGYFAVWEGQKSWNGVAILSRRSQPIVTRRRLPGDSADRESRYIEAAVDGLLIGCLYLPNGNPRPDRSSITR